MNVRTTIILAVLAALCGLVWLFTPSQKPTETPPPEDELAKYTQVFEPKVEPTSVVRMVVEQPGKARLVFERSGEKNEATGQPDEWRMVEPVAGATESWTVDGLASVTANLKSKRAFKAGDKGITTAVAGLDAPLATITLTDKGKEEYKLEVGAKATMSNDSYVRVAGADRIHQIEYDYPANIKKDPGEYRAKTLFKYSRNNAARIRLAHEQKNYEFAKNSQGEWVMEAPVRAYLVSDKVRNLVNNLANVRADKYVDDKPGSLEPFGLDKPTLSIEVTVEEKKKAASQPASAGASQPAAPVYETVTSVHGLQVGGASDASATKFFIKLTDQPWVATATKEQVDQLMPKMAELRDSKVTRLKAGAAAKIEIGAGDSRVELTKVENRWQGTGDLAQVDGEAVAGLLRTFEDLSALDYVDQPETPARYGLDAPRGTIKVTPAGAVEPIALNIGAATPSGRNTYAQVAGQPGVVVISTEAATRLAGSPLSLRARSIVEAMPDQIRKIELSNANGTMTLNREGAEWRFESPAGAPVDLTAITELTNDLSRLRAKNVVSKNDWSAYGLETPMLDLRFELAAPAAAPASSQAASASAPASTQVRLRVGQANRATYCRKDDEPFVFELDETVFRVLTGELIRRQLFDFDGKSIESIRITSNNGSLELNRSAGEWKFPLDPSVPLVQKKVTDFANELAAMKAERYFKFAGDDPAAFDSPDAITLALALKGKPAVTLKIQQIKPGEPPRRAVWVEQQRSFLMHTADVERLIRGLDYYVKPEVNPQPTNPDDEMPAPQPMPRP